MGRKQSSSSSFWHPRRRSASAPATPRAAADPPLGCMSMVHYLIFAPGSGCVCRRPTAASNAAAIVAPRDNYHQHRDHDHVAGDVEGKENKGGFEAPRNSLDLDADNLNDIQIGVQIEPVFDALACRKMRPKATAPSSEAETPRTPSLVARLMGIDGLPDDQSPSPAQLKKPTRASSAQRSSSSGKKEGENKENSLQAASKEKKKRVIPESMNREPLRSLSCNVPSAAEARSLPDTPRASTSARASWDGARLSLQALKENVLDRAAQYMSLPTSPTSAGKKKKKKKDKQQDADGRGVRREERERTAKDIVRQAKETVASRKLAKEQQRQQSSTDNKENVSPVPVRKDKLLAVVQAGKQTVIPSPSPSPPPPKARCTEKPLAPRVALLEPKHPPPPPPPQRAKPSRPPPPPPLDTPTRTKKPDGCERFATRIKKPAPASPAAPPAPASSPPSRYAAASSLQSLRRAVPLEEDPEYSYLRTVLERGGFMRSSPPSRSRPSFKGHSVASPVDPIVFHLLELELPADEARLGPLRHRWNRKLMFHLTQEILADLLLGLDFFSSVSGAGGTTTELPRGAALLARVWKRVRSFPAANIRVVGDIDALVATDLESASVRRLGRHPAVVEEASDVAEEVAERVLEELLGECVVEESLSLSSYCSRSSPSRAHR